MSYQKQGLIGPGWARSSRNRSSLFETRCQDSLKINSVASSRPRSLSCRGHMEESDIALVRSVRQTRDVYRRGRQGEMGRNFCGWCHGIDMEPNAKEGLMHDLISRVQRLAGKPSAYGRCACAVSNADGLDLDLTLADDKHLVASALRGALPDN